MSTSIGQSPSGVTLSRTSQVDQPQEVTRRRTNALDRWLAARLQETIAGLAVRVELWDGSSPYSADLRPIGDLLIGDRLTLIGLLVNPDIWFGEAYMKGRLAIRGSIVPVLEALSRLATPVPSWRQRLAAALAVPNSLAGARRNVHHHYDLGNDFYARWLDRELVYTCAYFPSPEASLEDAQRAKHDLVCRKLRLRPGESVVEAGCGWGALALHMARRCGVRVKAFNVSREQLAFARERAAQEGLTDRVEFIDDDYRNVSGRFDAFVSIGMLEHVGLRHFGTLATVLRRCLRRDGGRGLLHFIGRDAPCPLNAWIRRRVFPGAYPPTLAEVTTRILGPSEMSVIDVENLRLHYARTLGHWGQRFTAGSEHVRAAYGDDFRRAWELYLAGSEAAFATGWMQLFQVVFVPRESAPPSWTRLDPYEDHGAPA
jgi:cyclopropane-fatty-acyl-phospholipid synthase